MQQKTDVLQGTLALMVLKALDVLGPLHGYGVARRIEQISGDLLAVNQGTLYPVRFIVRFFAAKAEDLS
jgi:PadR family transcriptional regulator, regulatory protein PadR